MLSGSGRTIVDSVFVISFLTRPKKLFNDVLLFLDMPILKKCGPMSCGNFNVADENPVVSTLTNEFLLAGPTISALVTVIGVAGVGYVAAVDAPERISAEVAIVFPCYKLMYEDISRQI
jgi:hypothetical protein